MSVPLSPPPRNIASTGQRAALEETNREATKPQSADSAPE